MSATSTSAGAAASSTDVGIDATAGKAQTSAGQSIDAFLATLSIGAVVFGIEVLAFLILKNRFTRIFSPRTFLVPERERTKPPPKGLWQWAIPVFRTSNAEFIEKCGLDAYFFLRYLRLLIKIFVPLSCVILPILLPLNAVHGRGPAFAQGIYAANGTIWTNVTGLDKFAWGNVPPNKTGRYWGHLVLALFVIFWVCYVFYDELRGYIRLRQAYLTSPQHRLRASATTVLVTAIPRKWCTVEALDGLYDVFPGGIRNIWINRNFDELNDKVKLRNKYAQALESAETALIRNAKKAHDEQMKKEAKKAGVKQTKQEKTEQKQQENEKAEAMAGTQGTSTGNPHQIRHTVDEAINDASSSSSLAPSIHEDRKRPLVPIPVVGQGIEAVGQGLTKIGNTVFGGLRNVGKEVDDRVNTTGGFMTTTLPPATAINDEQEIQTGVAPGYHITTPAPRSENGGRSTDQNYLTAPNARSHNSPGRDSSMDSTIRQSSSQDEGHRALHQRDGTDGADSKMPQQNQTQAGQQTTHQHSKSAFQYFKQSRRSNPYDMPSPTPHGKEEDEFPLGSPSPISPGANPQATINGPGSSTENTPVKKSKFAFITNMMKDNSVTSATEYPEAYDEGALQDFDGEPLWKKYIKPGDRDTMRLPIKGWNWMPSLPLVGKKVDTIDFCRREVARLNVEIEQDQNEPEKFPLMNSAFIQFNHQVAAHMACQAVSHHIPNQMAPRLIEVSPDDVVWDNMSLTWIERYVRTFIVWVLIIGLIIGWAFPVTFTGLLSQVSYLERTYTWLAWLERIPPWIISIIQGVLPQVLLALLLIVLPFILRILAKQSGSPTGMGIELSVQGYYFFFLFVQVFLIVSISSGITTTLKQLSLQPEDAPSILAGNLPKASNYFFSYMLLQALSVSAGALLQVGSLIGWFILGPLLDNTAREKWKRQLDLPNMKWGTFFPVYTNLAAIGIIYSVISPLIMVFNIITFSLFWVAYRYNTLYVTKFQHDTGGLLFPRAINQLFTGLYVMELALIGLFFIVRNVDEKTGQPKGVPCKGQAIIMIVALICTLGFQWLLNRAFGPLLTYLPITLEDEAVIRDEQFAAAQSKKWNLTEGENEGEDINDALEAKERREQEEEERAEEIELQEIQARKSVGPGGRFMGKLGNVMPDALTSMIPSAAGGARKQGSWADRSRNPPNHVWTNDSRHSLQATGSDPKPHGRVGTGATATSDAARDRENDNENSGPLRLRQRLNPVTDRLMAHPHHHGPNDATDLEAQAPGGGQHSAAIGEALFSGLHDEIEDLTPDERDKLVRRAFQHAALRARRPVIWIPRDDLGVSDDEILRTRAAAGGNVWISNEFTGLDAKGKVVFGRSPPDFSEVDLIVL
ncbi:hypothetical protein MMC25_004507 [Agyrium rufum]|nr:hypothetical protein [Agyrium rufum]